MNNKKMLAAGTITNEMLYELIRDFKEDVNRRFEDARNERAEIKQDMDRRFEQVDRQFIEIRQLIKEDKDKLEKVYETRHKITADFTKSWMFGSLFIALLASTVVLAVSKAF